jgi:hypothetical protein
MFFIFQYFIYKIFNYNRPLASEGQVEYLQDLEKGSPSVYEPVLIVFVDSSLLFN